MENVASNTLGEIKTITSQLARTVEQLYRTVATWNPYPTPSIPYLEAMRLDSPSTILQEENQLQQLTNPTTGLTNQLLQLAHSIDQLEQTIKNSATVTSGTHPTTSGSTTTQGPSSNLATALNQQNTELQLSLYLLGNLNQEFSRYYSLQTQAAAATQQTTQTELKRTTTEFERNTKSVNDNRQATTKLNNSLQYQAEQFSSNQTSLKKYTTTLGELKTAQNEVYAGIVKGVEQYTGENQNAVDRAAEYTRTALQTIEDNLVQVATSGKISFESFIDQVTTGLTKLAVHEVLSTIVGGKNSGFSSLFYGLKALLEGETFTSTTSQGQTNSSSTSSSSWSSELANCERRYSSIANCATSGVDMSTTTQCCSAANYPYTSSDPFASVRNSYSSASDNMSSSGGTINTGDTITSSIDNSTSGGMFTTIKTEISTMMTELANGIGDMFSTIFNSLSSVVGGLANGAGGFFELITSFMVFHSGGVIGHSSVPLRQLPASLLLSAPRAHNGLDLAHDEVPIIAQRGEMVLSRNQAAEYRRRSDGTMVINNQVTVATPNGNLSPQSLNQLQTQLGLAMKRNLRRNA